MRSLGKRDSRIPAKAAWPGQLRTKEQRQVPGTCSRMSLYASLAAERENDENNVCDLRCPV